MAKSQWADTPYRIVKLDGTVVVITVKGRDKWALDQLIDAGSRGCTPIQNPAPRWSAYVFNLRKMGVQIDTNFEAHGGEFSGLHGRYILRSAVLPIEAEDAA
jgi:hypothetical protein